MAVTFINYPSPLPHWAAPGRLCPRRTPRACSAPKTGANTNNRTRSEKKPHGYWSNFDNLQNELVAYQQQNAANPNVMPSATQLRANGRRDLENAINNNGGYAHIAQLLNWRSPQLVNRPPKYWNDFNNLKIELLQFIQSTQRGSAPHYVMPTQNELRKNGRADIALAIDKHGGFIKIAESLKLHRRFPQKPKHYWHDLRNVEREVRQFIDQQKPLSYSCEDREQVDGDPSLASSSRQDYMPLRRELQQAGRGDLAEAIREHHGGHRNVARKLGLASKKKDDYYYQFFHNLAREVYIFTNTIGSNGLMPTTAILKAYGRSDIVTGISKNGGMSAVSQRLGLLYKLRTKQPLKEWFTFRKELESFMNRHGSPDSIPSSRTLLNYGRNDLYQAILHHGGARHVGDRMCLKRDYWQDFHDVGFDVIKFIDVHGTPGIMPTEKEFALVQRSSLNLAVEKMGSSQVAQRLGLREASQSKQRALDVILEGMTGMGRFNADGLDGGADASDGFQK